MGAAEPAITIVGASIPALRVLLTDFKHFTQRRLSEQSESQGSNFDFWDDSSRSSRWSLFKWNGFASSKSAKASNMTGTTSTMISCGETPTLSPPAGLAADFWRADPTEKPRFNREIFGFSETDRSGISTPKTSISVPRITRPAPSHNYPNLSQQLEDFLWSRKNSYAGTLNDSIYDGNQNPVVDTVSKNNQGARATKKHFLSGRPLFERTFKDASNDDSDRDTWSLSSVLEHGQGDKESSLHHGCAPGHFVVVQTTEITVEFE